MLLVISVKLVKHSFWYHLHCQHQESNGGVIDMERSNIDDNVHSCIRKSVLRLADPESYDQNKQMIKIDMPKIKNFQQYEDGTRKYLYYSFSDKWSFRPTPLGKAIVISSLPVQESITLFEWLSTKTISVFNKLPTLSLVVPIYVRFIELKGKPKSEFTMLAWQNMTNSFQRLTQNQKESLITMGYRDEVVEHILRGGWYSSNTSELLKTYERIAKTLILNDACEKPNPSGRRKLATKHKLSQGKLDQALLEVSIELIVNNFIFYHSLFLLKFQHCQLTFFFFFLHTNIFNFLFISNVLQSIIIQIVRKNVWKDQNIL